MIGISTILGLFGSKPKMTLYLGITLVVALAVGYHFMQMSKFKTELINKNQTIAELNLNIATLEDNQQKLEQAIATQRQSIKRLETQRTTNQRKLNQLVAAYGHSQKEVGKLRKLLSKHDIGYLMLRKPGLLENRINKASRKLGEEMEKLTGGSK